MKNFHISDVLSITTGRLVSSRNMDGIYEILSFLTGDEVYTHQIPRVMRECEPWLKTQFPLLFPDNPEMARLLAELTERLKRADENRTPYLQVAAAWVEEVRNMFHYPEWVPVYEMGADMHRPASTLSRN